MPAFAVRQAGEGLPKNSLLRTGASYREVMISGPISAVGTAVESHGT